MKRRDFLKAASPLDYSSVGARRVPNSGSRKVARVGCVMASAQQH